MRWDRYRSEWPDRRGQWEKTILIFNESSWVGAWKATAAICGFLQKEQSISFPRTLLSSTLAIIDPCYHQPVLSTPCEIPTTHHFQ